MQSPLNPPPAPGAAPGVAPGIDARVDTRVDIGSGVLRPLVLFALSFAATCWGLRQVLPRGEGDLLSGKLAAFAEQDAREPFNVVFLGSSRVYFGVAPELFDRRMAEHGHPTRSFNLGITAQKAHGAYGTLRSLAALEPRGIEYVVIDPERLSLMLADLPRTMRGHVFLHDPASAALMLEYLWGSGLDLDDKLSRGVEVLRACAYDVTNVGRGLFWLDALMGRAPTEEEQAFRLGPAGDGWRSKDDRPNRESAELHERFVATPGRWERQVERFIARRDQRRRLHPGAAPFLTRLADLVRAMGAEPVFLVSPSMDQRGPIRDAHESGVIDTLLRFNDAQAYPELYDREARWEAAHLSAEGARRFSIALADRFADWLEERAARGEDGEERP